VHLTFIFEKNSLTQDLFLKPIIISEIVLLLFFLVTIIYIRPFFGYIHASEKIFVQIVSPLKLILSPMAMFHALFQQF